MIAITITENSQTLKKPSLPPPQLAGYHFIFLICINKMFKKNLQEAGIILDVAASHDALQFWAIDLSKSFKVLYRDF